MKSTREKIEIMEHFEKGGKIEASLRDGDTWLSCGYPNWNWKASDYRPLPEPKYRPYTMEEYDKVGQPIVVKKKYPRRDTICWYTEAGLYLSFLCDDITWEDFLNNYTHLDGSPCGVEV
jgi:hypothetical protein